MSMLNVMSMLNGKVAVIAGFILTEITAQGAENFIPDIAAEPTLYRAGESPEVAEVDAFLARSGVLRHRSRRPGRRGLVRQAGLKS